MAYDAFGNYVGPDIEATDPFAYETEEERRKRLASEVKTKQEVTTYGDGSQTRTVKEEIPAAGPVSPETFARMQQAESGGRDFDAQGRPLTSPKGAMFANQVMPATAASPGFGVRPAQAQTPEEYNRVGQEYYQALLKKYNGDERAAAAAYNAGPGRVDKNIAANAGQLNPAQLPRETQGYLSKVFDAIIPSAQAGTLTDAQRRGAPTITPPAAPTAPVAPQAMAAQSAAQPRMQIDEEGNRLITNADGTTTILGPNNRPMMAGGMEPRDTPEFRNRLFEEAGKDPFKWMEISKQPEFAQFPAMQTVAKQQARALLEQEFKMNSAKEQATQAIAAAAQGDPKAGRAIADELKNQEGSWVKMILLGFLSPELAGEEAIKLGFGNKWQSVSNEKGETALIQVNAKGLPLKGISADNRELTQEQLASFATGGKRELDIPGGTYINDKTGEVGRVVTDKRTGQSYVQTDTGRKPMTGFRPQSSTGGLADMRARQIQEINLKLQGKGVEEQMAILRDYNKALVGQGFVPVQPSEVNIAVPQIAGGAPAPAAQPAGAVAPQPVAPQPAAAPAPARGAPVAPVPLAQAPQGRVAPAGAPTGARPTMTELEAGKTIAKESAEVVGKDIGTTRANQGKAEQNADYLITKINELVTHPGFETSVGRKGLSYGFGLTKEPILEGTDASDFQARFKEIGGQSFLQAIENLRGMGALSNLEGESATKAIQRMSTSQSEKEFKTAAQEFNEIIQRGIDRNRVKLGQEPKYGTKPASEIAKQEPVKKLSKEDTQALEWARNNPDDPRAKQIKQRLGL